jgi:hypothetical protein
MWRHNPDPKGNARFQSLKAGVYTSGCQRLTNRSKNGNGLLRHILEFEFIFIVYTVITFFIIFSVYLIDETTMRQNTARPRLPTWGRGIYDP